MPIFHSNNIQKKIYTLGVTVGRFAPFHRGNEIVFKKVAPRCDKIAVFVAGQKESLQNPFSYQLRKQIIAESLGPITYKVTVMPAIVKQGKKLLQTGYVYTFLDKLDALPKIDAVILFVGADRYKEYKKQFIELREKTNKFNKIRIVNGGVGLNEFGEKIDATVLRGALLADDKELIKKYLAESIAENPNIFKDIYNKMKNEIETTYQTQQFDELIKNNNKSE